MPYMDGVGSTSSFPKNRDLIISLTVLSKIFFGAGGNWALAMWACVWWCGRIACARASTFWKLLGWHRHDPPDEGTDHQEVSTLKWGRALQWWTPTCNILGCLCSSDFHGPFAFELPNFPNMAILENPPCVDISYWKRLICLAMFAGG